MNNPIKNISVLKIAKNMGDVTVSALEVYKTVLSVKYFAADSLLKAVKMYKTNSLRLKGTADKAEEKTALTETDNKNVKENTSMKKSTFWALIAFLAAVMAAIAGVAYYLKKREAELEEYEDMLFNEDYLADYLPKDDECCCYDDCCYEETPAEDCEQPQETYTEE